MKKFVIIFMALTFLLCAPVSKAQDGQSVAALVERVIKEKEPGSVLVKRQESGALPRPQDEEMGVTFLWKLKGQEIAASVERLKTEEAAANDLLIGTATAWPRHSYKLSADGEKLQRITDKVGFYLNESAVRIKRGRFNTCDVAFRKGRVVVVVEARKPELAQRFALHIAEALDTK